MVGEEQALSCIKRFYTLHLIIGEGEVKYVEIFFHALLVNGLGNDNNAALHKEAECCLCGCFIMRCADRHQLGSGEEIVPALGKGTP